MSKIISTIFVSILISATWAANVRAIDTYTITGNILIDDPADAALFSIQANVFSPFSYEFTFDSLNAPVTTLGSGPTLVSNGFGVLSSRLTIGSYIDNGPNNGTNAISVIDDTVTTFGGDRIGVFFANDFLGDAYEQLTLNISFDAGRTDAITGLPSDFSDNSGLAFVMPGLTSFTPGLPGNPGAFINLNNFTDRQFATYGLHDIGISISSAIPEPATWLMMIIGFAGVGLMAKRRRRMLEV